MSSIIHTKEDLPPSFGDEDNFLRGFNVSFSWEYPDDFSLKDVQDAVCFVYDEQDSPRSESQYICDCVQEAGAGVLLLKPHPGDIALPSEMHFQPINGVSEFCITKITVVSESRHLELYLDDIYEKTSKGCPITLKKGNKLALYENHFDLSAHVQSSHKFSLKFLSLGERNTMRLQAVIVKVTKCESSFPAQPNQTANMLPQANVDISGVRGMLESMGLTIPSKADKLMTDIEHQQKQLQMTQLQGLANVGLMAQLQQISQQQHTLQQQAQSMQFLQSMFTQKFPTPTPTPTINGHTNPVQSPTSPTTLSSRSDSPQIPHSRLTNGHVSPEGRFPVSRESVNPPRSRRSSNSSTLKSHSMPALDHYDGFGAPAAPSNGSILESAIRNEEYSREPARSRASLIEEQNIENSDYEKAQIEMVKNFLRSEDPLSRKLTITKLPPRQPEKPPRGRPSRRGAGDRRPRPHSMSSLPATSEADFTKMLVNLMDEEKNGVVENEPIERPLSVNSNARWEAYLRSRVRASHRLSSATPSEYSDNEQPSNSKESQSCPKCGCPGCLHTFSMVQKELYMMEKRMTDRMESRIQGIQDRLESRMNQIYGFITGKHNIPYDEKHNVSYGGKQNIPYDGKQNIPYDGKHNIPYDGKHNIPYDGKHNVYDHPETQTSAV